MSTDQLEQLLREGIAAARTADKITAREKLQEVVELDPQNEKGWYWLASVVETDEEKRVCLGNVIVINPANARAKAILDELDKKAAGQAEAESGEKPASGRLNPRILIGGGIALVVLVILLFVVIINPGGNPSPTATPTGAVAVVPTVTGVAAKPTTALQTPPTLAPTLMLARPTLPPTWTPAQSSPIPGSITATPLASPPPGLLGQLVFVSGSAVNGDTYQVYTMRPGATKMTPIVTDTNALGNDAILEYPGSQHIIYDRYFPGTGATQIQIVSLDASVTKDLSVLWNNVPPLGQQFMPSMSRDGHSVAFSAQNLIENDGDPGIYYIPYNFNEIGTQAGTVFRVTAKGSGVNTWPALSPDGQRVAYVSKGKLLAGGVGTDLYLTGIGAPQPQPGSTPGGGNATAQPLMIVGTDRRPLTTDGDGLIEASPEFSPDGQTLVYQAGPPDQPNDIYTIKTDGTPPQLLVKGGGNNVRPHWSPDSKYVAFSSNRSGNWQVYVIEVQTGKIYQMTNTDQQIIYCTAWGN